MSLNSRVLARSSWILSVYFILLFNRKGGDEYLFPGSVGYLSVWGGNGGGGSLYLNVAASMAV